MICFLSAKHTPPLIGEVEFELIIFALWQYWGKQARRLTLYVIYRELGFFFYLRYFKWDVSPVVSVAAGCDDGVHYLARLNCCSFSVYSDLLFLLNSCKESCYNIFLTSIWSIEVSSEGCVSRVLPRVAPAGQLRAILQTSGLFWACLKCSVLLSWFLSWCSLARGWWLLKQFPCIVPRWDSSSSAFIAAEGGEILSEGAFEVWLVNGRVISWTICTFQAI